MLLKGPFQEIIGLKFIIVTFLALSVLFSAILVIYYQHCTRMLYSNLQFLESEKNYYVSEWSKLLLEHSAWTTDVIVDSVAKEKLGMEIIKKIEVIEQ